MRRLPKAGSWLCLPFVLLSAGACGDGTGFTGPSGGGDDPETFSPGVGVNYNGQLEMIDFADLERSETRWVRGFFDFFLFYENPHRLSDDPKVVKYLQLKSHGYKTILSLKWDFRHRTFPERGSQELEDYKTFLARMLDRLWAGTDIIVVGNEPFIESTADERGAELLAFYEEIARSVQDYANAPTTAKLPIYVGAFNRLDRASRQAEARDLLRFAATEPWIAGIDLHIHHAHFNSIERTLDFVRDRIRDDQRILITEYSLVWHWKSKLDETIPADFAQRHGGDPGTRNHEYIDGALKNPVPRDEWVDFLSSSYWFENRKRYLRNSYRKFREYEKFYLATYAMRQSFPSGATFRRNTDPWILNGLYANRTVEPDPVSGLNPFNYAWIDDFRAIQSGAFD